MLHRSPLSLAVLALLAEAPMHPYLMQRLLKERGKHRVINVGQRSNFYKTIERLHRDGMIEVRETSREAQRPERTTYEITKLGQEQLIAWMREMLSTPRQEFPEFPAAIAHMALLDPPDVMRQLELRERRLEESLLQLKAALASAPKGLPRLFSLEDEYVRALTQAELKWVRSLLADLRSGSIQWSEEWLEAIAKQFDPEDEPPIERKKRT